MSAFAMKPAFTDRDGYTRWLSQWRATYRELCRSIRADKHKAKAGQRAGNGKVLRTLHFQRAMGRKIMGLLDEGRARWARIVAMRKQIADQMATFPLTLERCPAIDFHFNRGHNEFPDLPMWVIKAKGRSYYVHHIDAKAPWSTRETPDGSTKGMLRFRQCSLVIDKTGAATILGVREMEKAA